MANNAILLQFQWTENMSGNVNKTNHVKVVGKYWIWNGGQNWSKKGRKHKIHWFKNLIHIFTMEYVRLSDRPKNDLELTEN